MALGPCAADTARCERRHQQPGLCSELQSAANGSPHPAETERARDWNPMPSGCGWRAWRGVGRQRSWPVRFEHNYEVERSADPGGEVQIQSRIECQAPAFLPGLGTGTRGSSSCPRRTISDHRPDTFMETVLRPTNLLFAVEQRTIH